jgi:hypothetical protein
MNMNKLFNALPRDLQWEVLTVFVGSHVVRKGKLIQKLVSGIKFQRIQEMHRIQKCYIGQYIQDFNTLSFVQFSNGSQLMFCEEPTYGELGYTFRQVINRECSWMSKAYGRQYVPMDDSVDLQPFEKHTYPSYEHTDKKKAIRSSKKIVFEEPMRLSLIRPCELDDNDEPDRFAGMSPLTLGECRTPDEPLSSRSTPYWRTTQFHIEL